jgi:hypothetical protein
MPLGPDNVIVQDRTDLNETVMESFPAHPKDHAESGSYTDEKKDTADVTYGEAEADYDGAPPYDDNGKDKVLG